MEHAQATAISAASQLRTICGCAVQPVDAFLISVLVRIKSACIAWSFCPFFWVEKETVTTFRASISDLRQFDKDHCIRLNLQKGSKALAKCPSTWMPALVGWSANCHKTPGTPPSNPADRRSTLVGTVHSPPISAANRTFRTETGRTLSSPVPTPDQPNPLDLNPKAQTLT